MLTEGQIQCMKEDMTITLAQILIEEQHYSMEDVLSAVYNSLTFRNLQNSATGYYYQSVGYLYDDLQAEIDSRVGAESIKMKSLSQLDPTLQELCGICSVDENDLNGDNARKTPNRPVFAHTVQ